MLARLLFFLPLYRPGRPGQQLWPRSPPGLSRFLLFLTLISLFALLLLKPFFPILPVGFFFLGFPPVADDPPRRLFPDRDSQGQPSLLTLVVMKCNPPKTGV